MSEFKLTILGSGTMMPTKQRNPSCYLLEIAGKKILLDIGHTSLARLVEMDIDLHAIDVLFVSHFHTDHFADTLPLLHARWVDDIKVNRPNKPITIIGPQTIQDRWQKLREVFWPEPKETYPITWHQGAQMLSVDNIEIELFDVYHVPHFPSLGIKVSFQGKTLVYPGDFGSDYPLKKLEKVVHNIDLLLIEAGAINPSSTHFTMEQIVKLKQKSGVKKVIATHLRDMYLSIIQEQMKGQKNIFLAEDGMKIDLLVD